MRKYHAHQPLLALIAFFLLSFQLSAQEWTRFRGPNGSGVSPDTTIPADLSAANLAWKVELPAAGHSCPVLWGNKIFLSGADNDKTAKRFLFCLNSDDGKLLWKREYDSEFHKKHQFNSFATPTATVDASRVYHVWSTPLNLSAVSLDHEGHEVWRRDLGPYVTQHSAGSSPVLVEDLVLLTGEQDEVGGGKSFLIALDAKTGETRWQVERKSKWNPYSTPCVWQPAPGAPLQVIFCSIPHGVSSVDARTGKTVWELPDVMDKRPVASPIILQEKCVTAMCGFGSGGTSLTAITLPTHDSSQKASVKYKLDKQVPYVPTPVARGDWFFFWGDNGIVSCHLADSGKQVWKERIGGNYFASPVLAGDHIYNVSTAGEVIVIAAAAKYKLLSRFDLGELCHSTPAIAGGKLFVRTYSHLAAFKGAN